MMSKYMFSIFLLGVIIGSLIGFYITNRIYQEDVTRLKTRVGDLENRYKYLEMLYEDIVMDKLVLEKMMRDYDRFLIAYRSLEEFNKTVLSRTFIIYNYRTGKSFAITFSFPGKVYIYYKFSMKHKPVTVSIDKEYIVGVVRSSIPVLKNYSMLLYELANYDQELFVNYVLQITHQIKYNSTYYSKYPVETLIDGVGDCDNLVVLAASLIKAVGIDTVIIIGKLPSGYHAMLGVRLGESPNDLYRFRDTNAPAYIVYKSNRYYLAETTWNMEKHSPLDPLAPGFFVGDDPWHGDFEVLEIINV